MNSVCVYAMNDMTFFACCCLLDFVIVLKSKFIINNFIDLAEQNGVMRPNILLILVDSTYYICCKETIQFLIQYYPDFYEKCMEHCPREYPDPESVNCLDLCEFGFEDFCFSCQKITISFLLKCLIKM